LKFLIDLLISEVKEKKRRKEKRRRREGKGERVRKDFGAEGRISGRAEES
jgi:hypothetical protein